MRTLIYYLAGFAFLLASCTEKKLEPINKPTGKPGVVTEVVSTPTSGGAVISFRIPDSEDILFVKAVYKTTTGKESEAAVSYYGSQLILEGYNDMEEHEALLYTVSRAGEMSDPVPVRFTPLESPLSKAVRSASISGDFGGANFSWENEERIMLTLEFLTEDARGDFKTANIISSGAEKFSYTLRGYPPEPRKFALIMSDRWGNVSDTLRPAELITPYVEIKLNKKDMRFMVLDNDKSFIGWGSLNEYMINDNIDDYAHTEGGAMPNVAFTIDLGHNTRVSRFVMHQRSTNDSYYYAFGNPKTFDVYYRSEPPSQSGDWGEWTKLMECTVIKPSNQPPRTNTDEDILAGIAGHEFSLPFIEEPIRYLRFVVRTTWQTADYTHIAEMTFYGGYDE